MLCISQAGCWLRQHYVFTVDYIMTNFRSIVHLVQPRNHANSVKAVGALWLYCMKDQHYMQENNSEMDFGLIYISVHVSWLLYKR